MEVTFVVEHAGCASCGERVRAALAPLGTVRDVQIDEGDDSAGVRADFSARVSREAVDRTLVDASAAGHEYRVRPGSWQAAG